MSFSSREIRLSSRPDGAPTAANFEVGEVSLAAPGEGEVLVRNLWMSVDPYMRGRMNDQRSYVPPFQIGEALQGGALGEIVESNHSDYAAGDKVMHMLGWREGFVSTPEASLLTKVEEFPGVPLQSYLGALGMPGLTAYVGLLDIGEPKEGETVLVSAGSGAVGAVVCQIARIKGCRVVATAGSDEKCAWLRDELKVDAAINYKTASPNLFKALSEACPNGVDVYFENVGGEHLQCAIELMNPFGRLPMCGMISHYNDTAPAPGPTNLIQTVGKSLKMQGFIVSNHFDRQSAFLADMAEWAQAGQMRWKETVYEGVERAPDAFMALFSGDNFGKMLVKLA